MRFLRHLLLHRTGEQAKASITVTAALVSVTALPASAQDWATYDMCFPDKIEVHEAALAPFTLEGLIAATEAIPNATGRYWQITSPEGAVSHLWGTMHASHPEILSLPEQVEADIRTARVVALEADFVFKTREDYTNWATAADLMRTDRSVPSFASLGLPTQIDRWIRLRTEGIGWGYDAPEVTTLAGLASLILGDPCSDFTGGSYPTQDSLIQTFGAISGADIIGLEPPELFFETLGDPDNIELTRAILGIYGAYLNPLRDAKGTATGYALYLRGQIGISMLIDRAYAMETFGEDEARRLLALTNGYLVNERNEGFLQTALPYLDEGGLIMAIGSFHLPGEQGMITMLRDQGFNVERIALPGEAP